MMSPASDSPAARPAGSGELAAPTATTPFDGSSFEILLAHLSQPAPRPSDRRAGVRAVVDRLVGQLMEKRPDDRPATADAVVAAIDDALAELAGSGSSTIELDVAP
jgi:serine/threonine-protein kinase